MIGLKQLTRNRDIAQSDFLNDGESHAGQTTMMAGSSARAPTEMGYEDQCKSGSIVNLEFQKYNQLKTLDQKSDNSFEFPENEGVVNVTENNSPIKVI